MRSLPKYIYPHPSGYRVDYWPEGKRRCKTFRRLDEALAFWAKVYGPDPQPVTVSQLIDSYICGRLYSRLSPETQRSYIAQTKKLRAGMGHMRAADVTTRDIAAAHEHLGKRAPRSANLWLSVAQQVFKWGRMQGVTNDNPCDRIQRFPAHERKRYVTDDEFAAVLNLAPPSIRLAMMLTAITGLRQGDLLRLRFDDFGEDGLLVETGKTGQRLLFDITEGLQACIDYARTITPPVRGVVVCTRRGDEYTGDGFRTAWQRLMAKAVEAGVERFTFHDLRAKAGTETRDWRLLGHSDRRVFDRVYDRKPRRVTPVK